MAGTPEAPEDLPAFQRYQFDFTRRVRDPRGAPRPAGVAARRMRVYEEIVFNNFQGFVDACFPVLRRVLGKRRWLALVREFFRVHRCRSPLFRQIPEEFVKWLGQRPRRPEEPEFMRQLAHYEWVELAADVSPREPEWARIHRDGDPLEGRPALNPVSFLLSYDYPVHRIGPRFKPTPEQREATHLLVFRDLGDTVRFVVLNPVSARLLDLIQDGSRTGRAALELIAAELRHPDPALVVRGGLDILRRLHAEQALLGTWR